MTNSKKLTRRAALQVGLGAAAGAASVATAGGLLVGRDEDASCGTPAQTEGPFYPKHEQVDKDLDLTIIRGRMERAQGDVVFVDGRVVDENGEPVAGALVDIWQANTHGRYSHEDDPNPAPLDENFQGWGQVKTDSDGRYSFKTIVPGAYPVNEYWWRPPHIHFKVSRRGYRELTTQMYFAGNELNKKDHILLDLPEEDRPKVVVNFQDDAKSAEPGAKRGYFEISLCRVPAPGG
jgi:protocatechuate 3,4-dioxygenase beta subunit